MNDNLKQLSDNEIKELKARIESIDFTSFIEKTKAAGDDRTFEVVMSTSDEDRQGDALDQSGWDFKYFDMNPVLLWAHNYQGFPIGIITDIKIEGDKAVATGKFAPEGVNPEADLACALYQEKILRAVSPGYIQNDDGTRELLEVSFCPVPAGRYALSMRQVRNLGLSTRELIAKGFFYKTDPPAKKAEDDPVLGDACELDDGTPGVLAEDPKNPSRLVCVPPEEGKSKSNETQSNMNDELQKHLKTEHERHGGAVVKAIDEFEKAMPEKKAEGDSEMEKSIDEFETKMDGEHEEHLTKCMKAIDDAADKIDPEEKKSIDEFKSAMEAEHLKHVKCFDKAIEEFKAEATDPEKSEKALDEFRTKAQDELQRHQKAHMDMCKAEFGEGQDDGKGEKSVEKSGRAISAATGTKIESIIKAIEEYHAEHTADHQQFTDKAIAALKELMAPPQGDEGKDGEEKSHTPNARSSSAGAATNGNMSELDAYLFAQRLMRQVKSASEDGLRQIKENLKTKFPSRR